MSGDRTKPPRQVRAGMLYLVIALLFVRWIDGDGDGSRNDPPRLTKAPSPARSSAR
jgi:hypothetical protein